MPELLHKRLNVLNVYTSIIVCSSIRFFICELDIWIINYCKLGFLSDPENIIFSKSQTLLMSSFKIFIPTIPFLMFFRFRFKMLFTNSSTDSRLILIFWCTWFFWISNLSSLLPFVAKLRFCLIILVINFWADTTLFDSLYVNWYWFFISYLTLFKVFCNWLTSSIILSF